MSHDALVLVTQHGESRLPLGQVVPGEPIEGHHVFNKQHLGADRRAPATVSRRTFILGVAGATVWQGHRQVTRAAASCRGASTGVSAGASSGAALLAASSARPFVDTGDYWQLKDPCVVSDGTTWHLYGSGWRTGVASAVVFHARAESPTGPFTMLSPIDLRSISGAGVAAPGAVFEDGVFHMFVQTEFQARGGRIEHLVSSDGESFVLAETSLVADPAIGEAVLYDAQPCVAGGERYIAFAAATQVGDTALHLARSTGTWSGPWVRLGPIMVQGDVSFQNPVGCPGFEWGLEGPQLVELPGGQVLLLAVCFIGGVGKGRRQRVFAAVGPGPAGPFQTLGIPFDPRLDSWATGENGHPGAVVVGEDVVIVYQGRQGAGKPWSLGAARVQLDALRP